MRCFIALGLFVGLVVALSGCVAMPPDDYEFSGEKSVEINQHEYWADAGWACFLEADLGHKLASIASMGPFGVFFGYRGCAVVYEDHCRIHVIKGDNDVLRHELAHCDGWRHDHSQAFEEVRASP